MATPIAPTSTAGRRRQRPVRNSTFSSSSHARSSRGYILVQTLLLIAGLVSLMAIMAADQRASIQQVDARLDERRAEMAVDAAVARAEATLQSTNINLVTLNDSWASLGNNGIAPSATAQPAPSEYQLYDSNSPDQNAPTFRMQVIDAASLINLNAASAASTGALLQQTTALQGIQQQLLGIGLTQQQVDCLLDWEQTQTTARSDGAKDDFYNALQQPYNTKLGPLSTVNEVLLIDNWTGQTLYQPPTSSNSSIPLPVDSQGNYIPLANMVTVDSGAPNTQADGQNRTNVTSPNANLGSLGINNPQIQQQARRTTSFQQLLNLPGLNSTNRETQILNSATFTTGRLVGKVNLNTASQAVLQTVPGMTTDIASAIVTQQGSGFQTLGALASVNGMTPLMLRQIADQFSVGSDTFIVRAYGHCGNIGVPVEAVIRIANSQPQIITWERLNMTTVPTWWNWGDSPGSADAVSTT